jgi:ABC-type bacteriocin/lantibiotic exporter with double-glycine peptidase domain
MPATSAPGLTPCDLHHRRVGQHFLNKMSALLVLWVGAYLVLQGELSLGQLIAFRIISGYVTAPLLRLAQLWQNFQETALSLERLSDILDHPQEAEEQGANQIQMPDIQGHVATKMSPFGLRPRGRCSSPTSLEFPAGSLSAWWAKVVPVKVP